MPCGAEPPAASLVVFARYPELGKVKTRLATGVTQEGALAFYKACAEHVFREVCGCPSVDGVVYVADPKDLERMQRWLHGSGVQLRTAAQLQRPGLGDRMAAALAQQLQAPGCSRALIVGTDIPDLSSQVLQLAVDALARHDLVVGPAEDGGFYLLGLTALPEGLFEGIAWSSEHVCQQQLANAARLGLRVAPLGTLPTLRDVDTAGDLRSWLEGRRAAGGREHGLAGVAKQLLEHGASGRASADGGGAGA